MSLALLVLTASAGGCSFMFSQGAPADHEARLTFLCGESMAPPILDTVAVGVFAISLASGPPKDATPSEQRSQRAIAAGAAAVSLASAVYGYAAVSDCRAAKRTHELALARAGLLPAPYGLPPYGVPPLRWPPVLAPPRLAAPPPPPPIEPMPAREPVPPSGNPASTSDESVHNSDGEPAPNPPVLRW